MTRSSSASPDSRPPRPSLLRGDARFRRYFLGVCASTFGDRVTFVALPFAVLSVRDAAGAVALVVAAQTVPFALLALLAGAVADRWDRRRIVLVADLVRAITQGLAAVLLLTGSAELWHLAVLAATFGTAEAFFRPATQGMLPQLVAADRLQEANASIGVVDSSAMIAGPALAGVLVATLGPGGALAVDAATFLVSFACLVTVVPDRVVRTTTESLLAGIRGGWAEVRSRSWLTAGLAGLAMYTVVVLPAIYVIGPVLAERELGGAGAWAAITVVFGLGTLVGNAIALRWRPRRPMVAIVGGLAVASLQAAIIGSGLPVAAIAALEGVAGVGVALFFTLWDSVLQEQVPEHALSRVTSYDFLLSIGLSAVGAAAAGPVAEAFGVQETLLGMSAVAVPLALALLLVPSVRSLSRPGERSDVPGTS